ncbi:extracellular solute-binding protein [Clostridium grantii]|uniref:Putative aldouronate transport system substrate-binding protein n=1 Tax=Clostridium grantii DSM 8605 TaxID=1121316 RepID=A0A1M5WA75_9CLOT|nr:extracellular solute-binding protein [Clostridium grantii]SHH84402.1 putative aldouronate transport system substrate-binding protein [Clostridium grantii DSM 8605]
MIRRSKKFGIISLTLVLAMSMSLLAGCGKKTNDSANDAGNQTDEVTESGMVSDTPIKFTMLYADNASYPYKSDWIIWDKIKEATNVEFEIQSVPDSDYTTKKQIIFNSGDIPDIVTKTAALPEDAQSGILLPISDYLDKLPNMKKYLDENGFDADMDNLVQEDGKFYTLPTKCKDTRIQLHSWLIREDIFEKNNIAIPTTLDEVYEAGKKLKEIYPDSKPIINRFGSGNILSVIAPGFGTQAGWNLGNSGYVYDEESDKWVFAPTSDNYKEMLTYMNKLYTEGILDPEFTTLESATYEQLVTQSETFIMIDWVGNQNRYNLEGQKTDPDFNVQPFFPVKGADGDYAVPSAAKFEQSWVIPASVKDEPYFNTLLRFIDWCYTEEAAEILTFGVEGETFEKGTDGKLSYIDISKDISKEFGLGNNSLSVRVHKDFNYAFNGEEISNLFDEIDKAGAVKAPEPGIRLSGDEIEEVKLYSTALTDYINVMTESLIYGKESFSDWDKFVTEYQNKGSDKLGEIYNTAWTRQNTK